MVGNEKVKLPKDLDLKLKKIRPVFERHGILAAYLFGSRADGSAHPNSDYDFGILVMPFDREKHNLAYATRLGLEMEDAADLNRADVVLLNTASIMMRFEIMKRGRLIYCRDHELRTDFEDVVIRDYLDFKPFLDQYYREVREAIREGDFFA